MQKRILVPLDGSALADRIVEHVKRLLLRRDYEVVLLSVVEPEGDPAVREEKLQDARDHLEGIRDALVDLGAVASTRVVTGDPVEEIIAQAEKVQPELVAMATHGRSGLTRFVRGSVAEQVIRGCPAPVLVANPRALDSLGTGRELRFRRILVPVDGSEVSLGVLPLVEELARLYDSQVLLLRVEWTVPVAAAPYPAEVAALRPPREVEASLEPVRKRLEQAGLRARAIAAYGPEALEILDAADREDVDLVAMSTHGRSGLSRWIYGSVAEQVIRHCTRPLLVRRVFKAAEAVGASSTAAPAKGGLTP